MKKWFKFLGIFFAVILLLMVAIPLIFKGDIVKAIKEETNKAVDAKVTFDDFSLSLITGFPNLKLGIEGIKVDGVNQFEGVTLASIDEISLKIGLMSIINGEAIDIKSILIDGPTINALVLADSTANWDIAKATEEEEPEETEEDDEGEGDADFKLALQNLTISNGNVSYHDHTAALTAALNNIHFTLSGDLAADQTSLNIATTIDTVNVTMDHIPYLKNVTTKLTAQVAADMVNNKYTFTKNELSLNELTLGLDGWIALLEDGYDMDLTYHTEKTAFRNILSLVPNAYTQDFASIETAGKLALNGHAKGKYEEELLPGFELNLLVEDAMFHYPDLPKSVDNIQVNLNIQNPGGDADQTKIDLKRFYLEMAENPVDVKLKVSTPVSDADIDGAIKGKMDLASIKDVLPLEANDALQGNITADVQLKGRVSAIEAERYEDFHANGQVIVLDMNYKSDSIPYATAIQKAYLNFSPQFVELAAFEATIGSSDMAANGKIENFIPYFFGENQAIKGNFEFTSNQLNLNEFMEEDEETSDTETTEEETPLEVIEVPRNVDFVLSSKVQKLIYDQLQIDNLVGKVSIKEQRVSMDDVNMNLLGGNMLMNGYYATTNPNNPEMDFALKIKNFDVQQTGKAFNTVEKLAPLVKNSSGAFDTELSLNGPLNKNMEPILEQLTGKGSLTTKNIQVEQVKTLSKLATVLKNDKFKKIRLEDTDISYEITDGKVILDPFDIKMDNTTGTLSGYTTIDQKIDYTMALKVPSKDLGAGQALGSLSGQASKLGLDLSAAEFVNVDVLIGGTFENPTIKPSIKNTVGNLVQDIKDQVKTKVKEEVKQVKDNAKQKAKAGADKILKQAETQANKIRKGGKDAANAIRSEADKQAQQLIKQAGNNFIKKKAAEAAAKKLRSTAKTKAAKTESEANQKADAVMNTARKKADNLLK